MVDVNFPISFPSNLCLVCGAEIPEGRMICPTCGTRGGVEGLQDAAKYIGTPSTQENFAREITYSIDHQLRKAYNSGYTEGFQKGIEHYCEIKSENERLKRENALLRSQIENQSRIDDLDGEYE